MLKNLLIDGIYYQNHYINSNVRALFKRILCPNPNDRITMEELKMNCIYNMGKANFLKYYKNPLLSIHLMKVYHL